MVSLDKDWKTKIMNEYLEWRKTEIPPPPEDNRMRAKDYLTQEEREKYWTPKFYLENKETVLAEHKAYHETHKEDRGTQRKQHYEEHKQEILKKQKEWGGVKITCEICGSTFRRDGKADHLKTKKHREAIK